METPSWETSLLLSAPPSPTSPSSPSLLRKKRQACEMDDHDHEYAHDGSSPELPILSLMGTRYPTRKRRRTTSPVKPTGFSRFEYLAAFEPSSRPSSSTSSSADDFMEDIAALTSNLGLDSGESGCLLDPVSESLRNPLLPPSATKDPYRIFGVINNTHASNTCGTSPTDASPFKLRAMSGLQRTLSTMENSPAALQIVV